MRRTRSRRGRRRAGAPQAEGSERWAVSYADLVTLLFAFFTTLYAMSGVDDTKVEQLEEALRNAFAHNAPPPPVTTPPPARCITEPIPPLPPPPPPPKACDDAASRWTAAELAARRDLERRLTELLQDPALAGRVRLSPDPRGVRLTLGAAAFFEPGHSELKAEADQAMNVLGKALARHPGDIVVEGHTDNTPMRGGPFRSNWELSTARATEVLAMLVEDYDVHPQRLAAAGYGEHRPVADNDSPKGRAENRRVDIVVIPQAPPTDPASSQEGTQ